ncbi:MAG: Nicotinate phosphoribosyltransferase [Candidatus Saccharicenans subterraneus]|uniref:Nicotinate phosphoribosyltransferase n=1 Tax=Candidatus Saccharicenans subterraneus TaxID=2508984 RepID=A0A3E2BQR3_9BACT|nr:MAG: Nicotinate phosphoribosyltransferase [Candidatus Saccharicenans subterraneum]
MTARDGLFEFSPLYTDLYQIAMGQAYFLDGTSEKPAVFDYFFRTIPFSGGYVIFAGLDPLLQALESLRFEAEDLEYLRQLGFHPDYLEYLKSFRFEGDVYSMKEGEVVFPLEPIIRVEGRLFEAQLVETLLLNLVNYQSLIATKASRMRQAAGHRVLSDFGLRRAPAQGGLLASRAAVIGGFDSTSNVEAARLFGLEPAGTMAHSFIESHGDEFQAFMKFVEANPERAVLLVDTYDTLGSGVPNAVRAGLEMARKGLKLKGIRLDSGDLAYLSKKARAMLDAAGLKEAKIVASNLLDEHVIRSLIEQGAPIDIFGVGTKLVTGVPDAALDGVYKLAVFDGQPRMKLSDNLTKTTLPGRKQVSRFRDSQGFFMADAIQLADEPLPERMFHPVEPGKSLDLRSYQDEPLLEKVMAAGRRLKPGEEVEEIAAYARQRLMQLPPEHKRFEYPHVYKVGLSQRLLSLRNELMESYRKKFEGG